MITLTKINLRRGQHLLLEDVKWTIFHKQRIGLIGANGSGKSSLFAMLLGHIQADSGELELPRRLKIAYVAQETPAYSLSALAYVLEGDSELKQLELALANAERNNDGAEIAILHARMSEIDAYTAPARAAQLLNGLGFSKKEQEQAVSSFSGGWRVRLNLAKALISHSDMLLLDEPTNHLDLDAIIWLETWLRHYKGTLLLISHDREFLDNIVDHIVHIDHKTLKLYTGNYSDFEKQRAEQLLLQQSAYEKQQKHIAHLQSFINRFKAKATKAKQAQSRVKAIERMELVSAVQADSPFQFHFKQPGKCSNPMLTLENASIQYGDKSILKDINLSITPEDRIALIGPNGAGKSSLIKLLAGELTQASGRRETSTNLKIGYFAQHQIDYLHLDETPLDHLRRLSPLSKEVELRTFLGSFGFSSNKLFWWRKISISIKLTYLAKT
jgi:ATP-binding cassette subfamily F protein 3